MEKKLRRRFILISTFATFTALMILIGFLNFASTRFIINSTTAVIDLITENEGVLPREWVIPQRPGGNNAGNPGNTLLQMNDYITDETRYTTRFFTADISKDSEIEEFNTDNISQEKYDEAKEIVDNIIAEIDFENSEDIMGTINNYIYRISNTDNGKSIVFVDGQLQFVIAEMISTVLTGLSSIILFLVFILSCVFSKKAVAPIVNAQNKQKEFITNVSHELKTPLAIIKANTEVMEVIEGGSEWTSSNHKQVERLNKLVSYLVSLTKFEEKKKDKLKVEFSISDAVNETAENFKSLSENKNLILEIDKNLSYTGDEESIRMMFSTLFENAFKYSSENSDITVALTKKSNKLIFTIKNKADNLEIGDYTKLFERFYKEDKSRNSSSNSFGIGLSIAQTITQNHKGNITAKSEDGEHIVFTVTL